MKIKALLAGAALAFAAGGMSTSVSAQCIGNCGQLGADGVVTLAPGGASQYRYVSTFNGVSGAGQISGVGGTDGSSFTTAAFAANVGDALKFQFNYVTSDGAGFADYAFALLKDINTNDEIYLFTARTQPTGTIAPGFGLPGVNAVLNPASVEIIGGGPVWAALGGDSGTCFDDGCGYTGWIASDFTIQTAGSYTLTFGVTNWDDNAFASGLAFDGVTIAGNPVVPGIPEPGTWAMMLIGFAGLGLVSQRRRKLATA